MASVSEILLSQGQRGADAIRKMGDIRARMYGDLGNIASGAVQQYAQEKQQAPIREQEQRMRDLQLGGLERDAAGAEASARESAALRDLFSGDSEPDPKAIMAIVGPERGTKIVDGLAALQDTNLKRFKSQQEILAATLAGMDALPEEARAEFYGPVRENLIQRKIITPEDAPEAYDPAWFQQARGFGQTVQKPNTRQVEVTNPDGTKTIRIVEDKPGFETTSAAPPEEEVAVVIKGPGGRPIRKLVKKSELRQGVEEYREPQGSGAPEPLHAVIGPDGKPVLLPRSQAVGKTPASGTSKAASGLEKRALNFFNRAQQADKELEDLESQIQQLDLGGQAWQALAPNFLQTQLGQSYTAAQRAFTEARLRKDSGAAIPPQEFKNDRQTYFAQPGDSNETLEQKRRGRAAILASLGFESGQALSEFVGDANEAAQILQGYKDRSDKKQPDGQSHAAVPTNVSSALKGQKDGRYTLSDGSVWIVQGGQIRKGS